MSEILAVYNIMYKKKVEPNRSQTTI